MCACTAACAPNVARPPRGTCESSSSSSHTHSRPAPSPQRLYERHQRLLVQDRDGERHWLRQRQQPAHAVHLPDGHPRLGKEYLPVEHPRPVSYTHLRAHETRHDLVCRLLLEKKK